MGALLWHAFRLTWSMSGPTGSLQLALTKVGNFQLSFDRVDSINRFYSDPQAVGRFVLVYSQFPKPTKIWNYS